MNDYLREIRARKQIYWKWYSSLTVAQRTEHYSTTTSNLEPTKRYYSKEVKRLPGVKNEIQFRKREKL